ncbi:MAG: isoamylase early set domain-containing protein [Acidobacteriota bacterium]
MLKKNYTKTGSSCRVTFKVPSELEADKIALLGEFNEWDADANPLKKLKDGSHSVTVSLSAGQDYRFRYLLDGERWENDDAPDRLVPNRFGSHDGLVTV